MKIPLSNPDITSVEINSVIQVLEGTSLSLGPKLKEFEERFADFIGLKYAVAVNSGTSGLHLCLKALGIEEGDEVLTTPFSFISSANCILFEKAKPVFIDIDENSLNMDMGKLRNYMSRTDLKTRVIQAILPVHVFGRPCEMQDIMELAGKYGLSVIEDACEAIGAEIKIGSAQPMWKKVGTMGDCGVFAFYPNKQMTTGEGGMIVTDNEQVYKLCRSMRNQGRSDDGAWLQHQRLGYNYRLSDINSALGIAQLTRINELLSKREAVAKLYQERLHECEELIIPKFEDGKKISWFVYVVRLNDKFTQTDRDSILDKLRNEDIGCSHYFTPIHLQPFYRDMFGYKKGDFPITEKVSERTIALPFFNNLQENQVDFVCDILKNILRQYNI